MRLSKALIRVTDSWEFIYIKFKIEMDILIIKEKIRLSILFFLSPVMVFLNIMNGMVIGGYYLINIQSVAEVLIKNIGAKIINFLRCIIFMTGWITMVLIIDGFNNLGDWIERAAKDAGI